MMNLKDIALELLRLYKHSETTGIWEYCSNIDKALEDLETEIKEYQKLIDNAAQSEIIRCKDCKFTDKYNHCSIVGFWNKPDDFCSRAERRTTERKENE